MQDAMTPTGKFGKLLRTSKVAIALEIAIVFLPMALGLGGHSESWAPLANTIIWGMMFATVLTLVIIPAVYTIIVDDIATPLRHRIRSALNLPETAEDSGQGDGS